MKIIVSGGFGFIGIPLLLRLKSAGHETAVITRSIPGYAEGLASGITAWTADITRPLDIHAEGGYDIFIHLASANDEDSADPETAIRANALGTRNCLEFCARNGIGRFVYFSTAQVYGRDSGAITPDTPTACLNDYAITHLFGEEYARLYGRTRGIRSAIVRPANLHGALSDRRVDRWSLVPYCLCREAFERGKITLISSGLQRRDFTSLPELADAVLTLCEDFDSLCVAPEGCRVFNIASGESVRVIDIARTVQDVYAAIFGRECGLEILSPEPAESGELHIAPDFAGTHQEKRWSMEDTIRHTLLLLAKGAA